MPRSCCVPGCKSNSSSVDASGFRFPTDEQRRVQWIKAIHREDFMPTENTVVCAKHFEQSFIITEDSITRPDGTIMTAKRGWPTLTKDAFPTIFVNQPKYMTKEVPPARTTLQERRDRIIEHDEMVLRNWMENDNINSFGDFCEAFIHKLSKEWLFVSSDDLCVFPQNQL
ncbi:THAP domain-containing protein 2 [Chionoecetes opilio]|uniref:THAP domain-containing protein 2 n=1 Tax=Chionoecetes opilio TaxID=41210 RepID=A0A8J8W8Y4_CHIOP|nr:THAP domain-containing protein 2 [Chionoecetes opilio]